MTNFRTCHTCAKPAVSCPTREALHAALAGLRVTSVKHRCADYEAAFLPGDAVKVKTLAWYHNDDDPPPQCWFPGHFIRLCGNKALVVVPMGAVALDAAGVEFEPNSNGYLKVPLSRVALRDGPAADTEACRWCAAILGVGDACGRDPNYTPARYCLAETRRLQASQARQPREREAEGEPQQNSAEPQP
jgi:hypothetical protein